VHAGVNRGKPDSFELGGKAPLRRDNSGKKEIDGGVTEWPLRKEKVDGDHRGGGRGGFSSLKERRGMAEKIVRTGALPHDPVPKTGVFKERCRQGKKKGAADGRRTYNGGTAGTKGSWGGRSVVFGGSA